MSRSYHQRHRRYRNKKYPRTILDKYVDNNGKHKYIWRKRKTSPFGIKRFIGYGEETYSKKFGEFFETQVDKKTERNTIKKELITETENAMEDKERNKMIIESLAKGDKLYILNANGFDFDVFEITVLGEINTEKNTFLGEEFGDPYHKPHIYTVDSLYTKEELLYIHHINIK